MKSLLLDTSTSCVTASLFNDKVLLAEISHINQSDLSKVIFNLIDDLFKSTNIKPKEIDNIYSIVGPGSFTGIRIGVTFCKTFAYSMNKKVIPVSSLELMATTPYEGDYIVSLIDARRGYVYAGVYDHNLDIIMKDSYIKLDELISRLPSNKKITFVSYDEINIDKLIKPSVVAEKIIAKYYLSSGVNPHVLNPNYLKKTEAEENLGKEV